MVGIHWMDFFSKNEIIFSLKNLRKLLESILINDIC